MIVSPINMIVHNACYLSDLKYGHFIYNGKLYLKSRAIGKDVQYREDVYICLDEYGHYHSRGKNVTASKEAGTEWSHNDMPDIESELGDISRIAVTPITFEWKAE